MIKVLTSDNLAYTPHPAYQSSKQRQSTPQLSTKLTMSNSVNNAAVQAVESGIYAAEYVFLLHASLR